MGTDLDQNGAVVYDDAQLIMSPMEIDAIGEVLNISMGSAATAISSMLDKQVMITTPRVCVESLDNIDFRPLEPAIIVKITYTEGITGSNVMVFSQRDIQMILNQLMGIEDGISDNFVFDELSMSAACEVMNQMMGASATALSEFLGKSINISTPTAMIMDDENTFINAVGLSSKDNIISVVFNLSIADIMDTEFISVMEIDLVKAIVGQFIGKEEPTASAQQHAAQVSVPPLMPPMPSVDMAPPGIPQMQQQPINGTSPQMQQQPMNGMPPQMQQQPMNGMPPQMQQQPIPPIGYGMDMNGQPYYPYQNGMQPGYPPMYPYGYQTPPGYRGPYEMPEPNNSVVKQPVSVQNIQFPEFTQVSVGGSAPFLGGNMDLIMNVPLSVSVEIGKAKKKIKDIMEFNQGSVIELEKQAGAPVDIVVNGQLIARGDVVVIDDNFGVRVTEIIGTKELLNSLGNKQ